MSEPLLSVLVIDYKKPEETRKCLESIRAHVKVPYKLVLLDNGSNMSYPWDYYLRGLCDVLISKREGQGGGYGQTDLFRWCDTEYALFVQNDQELLCDITDLMMVQFRLLLHEDKYHCIDLNGDQSRRGVWTDRAHLIKTSFFNGLGPFPNGGPGNDAAPWNEAYLQDVFARNGYRIAHLQQALFADLGKWSVREAGDGVYKHRCDQKTLFVLKQPTYRTEVYPPLNDEEWAKMFAGQWVDGTIPEQWKAHSFTHWKD